MLEINESTIDCLQALIFAFLLESPAMKLAFLLQLISR